jgi:hypothetical protein
MAFGGKGKKVQDLRRANVRVVRAALDAAGGFLPFPTAADRAAVAQLRRRLPPSGVQELLEAAAADAGAAIPALPATLYLDFRRSGRREPYEDAQRQRRNMLYRLVLAAYLEGSEVFLHGAENLLWARLEETNWAWPAHARTLDHPDRPTLDLAAAMTALDLAEIDHLLGERLDPALRARLRHEVERRVVGPFLGHHDHWWLHSTPTRQVNNWTAVCVAGAVGAACYLEADRDRLAEIVARGLLSLADYLETFDRDGGSTEGPDYWSYGFGNFVVLAHLLACRTGGRLDLLESECVRDIAAFPLRTMLAPGLWVSFSDSDSAPEFHPGLLTHLAEALRLPDLTRLGVRNDFRVQGYNQFAWPLRQYAWPLPEAADRFTGAPHDWYPEMGWMISRLQPEDAVSLRLAVKAGHNGEMHNQNDVGSFMVAAHGRLLLTDPGRGRYSRAYFGPKRYDNLMASSRGHSVPVVNGLAQVAGRERAAQLLAHGHGAAGDWLQFDMAAAYPSEAGLDLLVRRLSLDRTLPQGRIELLDRFRFRSAAGRFESVLVTTVQAELQPGCVVVSDGAAAIGIVFDPGAIVASLEVHRNVEKQYAPSVDLTRIVFSPTVPRREGAVRLIITPRPSG